MSIAAVFFLLFFFVLFPFLLLYFLLFCLFFSVFCFSLLWRSADSPLNIADLCLAIPDVGLLYLLAYLLWLFILSRGQGRLWCSRILVKVRSDVLLVVLTLVYSRVEFSRCQRSICECATSKHVVMCRFILVILSRLV